MTSKTAGTDHTYIKKGLDSAERHFIIYHLVYGYTLFNLCILVAALLASRSYVFEGARKVGK